MMMEKNEPRPGEGRVMHWAVSYAERGWRVLPVKSRGKTPLMKKWTTAATADVERVGLWWTNSYRNAGVGIATGEASGIVVIDVDAKHDGERGLVELEGRHGPLPPTLTAKTGGGGRHLYFRYPIGVEIRNCAGLAGVDGIDVRGEGGYVVAPPSVHASGAQYEWASEVSELAELPPAWIRLLTAAKPPEAPAAQAGRTAKRDPCKRTLDFLLNGAREGERNDRLFKAAADLCGCGYSVAEAQEILLPPARRSGLDDKESIATIDSAFAKDRNPARPLTQGAKSAPQVGDRDLGSGKLILNPADPLPSARVFLNERFRAQGQATLRCYGGILFEWRDNHFVLLEDSALRSALYAFTENALRVQRLGASEQLVPYQPTSGKVSGLVDAARAETHLSGKVVPPAWLTDDPNLPLPGELLVCRSGLLHIPTRKWIASTPTLFATSALTFDYDAGAPMPARWLRFLQEALWPGDAASVAALQEWFGYCLTGWTSLQKMLLLVGPKRSGKGTIARVLQALIGAGNVAGPTTSSLAGPFGLQPLIGKTLAIVSDARFSGDKVQTAVERLLCISGEDTLSIDCKHKTGVTMKLPTRFMFLSNELPKVADTSGALAGRFIVLLLKRSFYDKEDTELTAKLLTELPGILLWAIAGWERLRQRGRFVQPESSTEAVRQLEDLSSPVGAFIRECCLVGATHQVSVDDLWAAWRHWCTEQGRDYPGTKQSFGRELRTAVPGINDQQARSGENRWRTYGGLKLKDRAVTHWHAIQPIANRAEDG